MTEQTFTLLWSEEFDGPAGVMPDTNVWNFQTGDGTEFGIPGWGNQEREFYIQEAVRTDGNGNLKIQARRVADDADPIACYYGNAEWTSSRLATDHKLTFKYGRIEARVKVPAGVGTWPAFWMLGTDIAERPWPNCGEIDIIEARGRAPREVIGTVHGPTYFGDNGHGHSLFIDADLSEDFHVFTVDWLPGHIRWYLDGEQYFELSAAGISPEEWVFDHEFYLLLNLAIGGGFAGDVDPALTEADLLVDYIRHYAIDGVGEITRH